MRKKDNKEDKIKVVARSNYVSTKVGDEEVLLDLDSGTYYGLNGVGSRVWNMVEDPKSIDEIVNRLVEEYDVTRKRCEQDIRELLNDMKREGLVESVTDD